MDDGGAAPALTDAKGMGGVIAQGGFDYQLWDGLVRLPAWLANPSFEELIFEGLEDLEARFFAPHAPPSCRLLERHQAKRGALSPAEVRDVLQSFRDFERSFPSAARVQVLVTPRLPPTLAWMARDPMRVRHARPFYAPFKDVVAASDAKLLSDLVDAYGDDLGRFVAASVEISERNLPDRDGAVHAFGGALERAFPSLDVRRSRIEGAFDALCSLAGRCLGQPLTKARLTATIEAALGARLGTPTAFPLHVRSDRNGANDRALEIDGAAFSGGPSPFPDPDGWRNGLVAPLDRVARWLRTQDVSRVSLGGSYRLSTAFAIGWSLRSAVGFELDIPAREGAWRTDERAGPEDGAAGWHVGQPTRLTEGRMAVCIGILRDPSTGLERSAGVKPDEALCLRLDRPVTSARDAQVCVASVRHAVEAEVARLGATGIDLFMAVPAAFAVALGHRWNAMPPTQAHEFIAARGTYVPTVRV